MRTLPNGWIGELPQVGFSFLEPRSRGRQSAHFQIVSADSRRRLRFLVPTHVQFLEVFPFHEPCGARLRRALISVVGDQGSTESRPAVQPLAGCSNELRRSAETPPRQGSRPESKPAKRQRVAALKAPISTCRESCPIRWLFWYSVGTCRNDSLRENISRGGLRLFLPGSPPWCAKCASQRDHDRQQPNVARRERRFAGLD